MLKINEIFDTIQGEAFYTGTPATFIRLQGCPVGCHWCDTKHTWSTGTEKLKIEIDEMLHKTKDSPKWSDVSEKEIVNIVLKLKPRHFVLTGGEPCSQDIFELTEAVGKRGGSFEQALALTLRRADPTNKRLILEQWPQLVTKFGPDGTLR